MSAANQSHTSDERYHLFSEATEEGVVIHDFGRILAANSHFSRMFGYPEDTVEGSNPFAFIAIDERKAVEAIARENPHSSGETIGVRFDGSHFPIELKGRSIAFQGRPAVIVRVRDLTKRREVEATLSATEERFRATFEQAAVGIAHVAVDGTWLRVNNRACAMTGYEREELLRLTFQDITHPDDLNADLELFNAVIAGARDSYSMEKRYFRKDRSIIWINLTVAAVRSADGTPAYFISIIEDISARKKMEETLRQSQKMEVVGQLTSSIAHDFGNFLNVVQGNLQLLQLSQLDIKQSEYVTSALAGAEMAEKLIRQLLSFSRRQEPEFEALDINTMIAEIAGLLRKAVTDKIALNITLCPEGCPAVCDRAQLETALFNLVLNARDALPGGTGDIEITTSITQNSAGFPSEAGPATERCVSIEVADNGHGMSPGVLARALEPFFTTKASGEGTGLGLSQVARSIAQMKGSMKIDSQEGNGTRVRLFLPLWNHIEP